MLQTKFNYEKVFRDTLDKDVLRLIEEEMPDAPVKETFDYIKSECEKKKVVSFTSIAFKLKD